MFFMTTTSLILIGVGRYLVSFAEMLKLYFLHDPVALSYAVAIIGFMGSANSSESTNPFFARTLQITGPITQFILTGTYRVIMKHANFKRWQNIIFKLVIFLDGLCFFALGFYIMYFDYRPSEGIALSIDSQFKDFSLLYVFGNLAYYKELCSLHNNFDRTNRLKYSYKLIDQQEDESDSQ